MILVIGEAFEDLGSGEIGKRGANAIHVATEKKVRDHIVDSDASAFDTRISAADAFRLHDIAIVRRGFHTGALYHTRAQDRQARQSLGRTRTRLKIAPERL